MNLKEIREKISKCWDEKTSFFRGEGSRGQCYVTALLVKQLYGGDIIHGGAVLEGNPEHHFWNRLPDGKEIDFTSDQYGGNGFDPVIIGKIYNRKPNFKNRRFLILKRRFECLQ